jgi:hypothetical protein
MNDHRYQRDTVANILRKTMNLMLLNQEDRVGKAAEEIVIYFATEAHASDLALAKARAYDAQCERDNAYRTADALQAKADDARNAAVASTSTFLELQAAVEAMQNGE